MGTTSAGFCRKARPRAAESIRGKRNVQKMASGSRKKRRKFAWQMLRNAWRRAAPGLSSFFTEMPPGQRHEDVFEAGRTGGEAGQRAAHAAEPLQERGYRHVGLPHGEEHGPGLDMRGPNRRQVPPLGRTRG